MRRPVRKPLFGLVLLASAAVLADSAQSQTYEERWTGFYGCGAHALNPDLGPFAWRGLSFSLHSGTIAARRDFRDRMGTPTYAVFNGWVDANRAATIQVISQHADGSENFHQTLSGRMISTSSFEFRGPMLNRKGRPVRNCVLTLSLAALPPALSAASIPEPPGAEPNRPAATHRLPKVVPQVAPAVATQAPGRPPEPPVSVVINQNVTQSGGTQSVQTGPTVQKPDPHITTTFGIKEIAAGKPHPPEKPTATGATRPKAHEPNAAVGGEVRTANPDRAVVEAELRQAEELKKSADLALKQASEALHAIQAAQAGENNEWAGLSKLPDTERRADWAPWSAYILLQEQQFCAVIDKFYDDLAQARTGRNEIKQNLLYKQRREALANLLPTRTFDGWVVHAVEVKQAPDGSAAVILQLPCKVLIGSDPCDAQAANFQGTIKENSALYRELATFDYRDRVMVGGELVGVGDAPSGPLPSYKTFPPGSHCMHTEAGDKQELFVVRLKSIFKLVPPGKAAASQARE